MKNYVTIYFFLSLSFILSSCVYVYSPDGAKSSADQEALSLDDLYISGACKLDNNTVDLSLVLKGKDSRSNTSSILPCSRIKGSSSTAEELITSQSFSFHTPSIMQSKIDEAVVAEGVAYVESENGLTSGEPTTVELALKSVDFRSRSADPEAGRTPLLILLMDQSQSLIGLGRSELRYVMIPKMNALNSLKYLSTV